MLSRPKALRIHGFKRRNDCYFCAINENQDTRNAEFGHIPEMKETLNDNSIAGEDNRLVR